MKRTQHVANRLVFKVIAFLRTRTRVPSASREDDASPAPEIEKSSFQCSSPENGSLCFEEACSFAGGQFAKDLRKCECPTGKNLRLGGQGPSCVTQRVQNDCLRQYSGFRKAMNSSDATALSVSLGFQNEGDQGSLEGNLFINLDNAVPGERETFVRWADSNFYSDFNYQFWESPAPFGDHIVIGGEITEKIVIDGFLKPYDLPDESIDYVNFLVLRRVEDSRVNPLLRPAGIRLLDKVAVNPQAAHQRVDPRRELPGQKIKVELDLRSTALAAATDTMAVVTALTKVESGPRLSS